MSYGNRSIDDWVDAVHALARSKGWWNGSLVSEPSADEVIAKIMLVVTELSEAVERVRDPKFKPNEYFTTKGKPDGFGVELADATIRIMDLCGRLGISLETMIRQKSAYNETRPNRHGGKRA